MELHRVPCKSLTRRPRPVLHTRPGPGTSPARRTRTMTPKTPTASPPPARRGTGSELIPPGSTPTRELLRAVADSLTMPEQDHALELDLLRLLAEREAGSAELVGEARILRALMADMPPGDRPALRPPGR